MKTNAIVLVGLGLVAPGCATYVSTVGGVTTVKFGAQATQEKLKVLNGQVNAARKSLLLKVGADPAGERAAMDSLGQQLAALRIELDTMKSGSKPWLSVDDNLRDAAHWNQTTQAALHTQLALRALEARALEDPPPSAQDLDAGEAVVQAFAKNVRKEWKDFAGSASKRMQQVRQNVAAGPELREKARAAAQAKAEAEAREDAKRRAAQAVREAGDVGQVVRKRIEAAGAPSEAEVAALAAALDKVVAIAPDEAVEGQKLLLNARIVRALDGDEPGAALQALLGGEVTAKGQSKGKALSVPLKVKKNHCLVWVGRYASYSGTERFEHEELVPSGDVMAAQRFTYAAPGLGYGKGQAFELHGACATRDVSAALTAKLEFTGTKNGVRYVALDFERSRFPRDLATRLRLDMPDHCDPEAWASMWLNPVPGSLAYAGDEPVIVSGDNAHYAGRPGDPGRTSRLGRAPPPTVKFTHQLAWKKCDDESGESPTSRALKACGDRIEKRYAAQWKSIDHARDIASDMSNKYVKYYSPAAEEKASRLRDAYDRDWDRECKPMQDKAQKAFSRRFESLVDQLTDARPVDVLFDTAAK